MDRVERSVGGLRPRRVDWLRDLAKSLGLTEPRSLALRRRLAIDDDSICHHVFEYGKQRISCFSDTARIRMKEAIETGELDMEQVWREHRPSNLHWHVRLLSDKTSG